MLLDQVPFPWGHLRWYFIYLFRWFSTFRRKVHPGLGQIYYFEHAIVGILSFWKGYQEPMTTWGSSKRYNRHSIVPGEGRLKCWRPTIILWASRRICTIPLMEPSTANGNPQVTLIDVIGVAEEMVIIRIYTLEKRCTPTPGKRTLGSTLSSSNHIGEA